MWRRTSRPWGAVPKCGDGGIEGDNLDMLKLLKEDLSAGELHHFLVVTVFLRCLVRQSCLAIMYANGDANDMILNE